MWIYLVRVDAAVDSIWTTEELAERRVSMLQGTVGMEVSVAPFKVLDQRDMDILTQEGDASCSTS